MMQVSQLLLGYGLGWWFVRVLGVVWVGDGSIMVWVRYELVTAKVRCVVMGVSAHRRW